MLRAALAALVAHAVALGAIDTDVARTWDALGTPAAPGVHEIRFVASGPTVTIPHCNGRGRVLVDDVVKDAGSKGTLTLAVGAGEHAVRVEVNVSSYEKRVACAPWKSPAETSVLTFASPHAPKPYAGQAVLFVPRAHDRSKPGALLVGLHPWNGTPWTYVAYRELLEEAEAKDVVLLMPSGLGNSLYVEDAEDEVMRAINAACASVPIDRRRVSIWGASMGGAGATTIAFHRPDRFAFVASWFGDSKYDMATYVRRILGSEAGAHAVNALDVVENARHLPVMLVHGEADKTSPIAQSEMLDAAMRRLGFDVRFTRAPGMGHEGPLVVRHVREAVDRAAVARAPEHPARVSFRSVRAIDTEAYGVRIVRAAARGDAFVDVEKRADGVWILAAQNVTEIVLAPGALGAAANEPVHHASNTARVNVRWSSAPPTRPP